MNETLIPHNTEDKLISYQTTNREPRTIFLIDFRNQNPSFTFNPSQDENIFISKSDIYPLSMPRWKKSERFEREYFQGFANHITDLILDPYPEDSVAKVLDRKLTDPNREYLLSPISHLKDRNSRVYYLSLTLNTINMTAELPPEISVRVGSVLKIVNQRYSPVEKFQIEKIGLLTLRINWETLGDKTHGPNSNRNYFLLTQLRRGEISYNLILRDRTNYSSKMLNDLSMNVQEIGSIYNP